MNGSGGHGIFGTAYADTIMHAWLFAQRKAVNTTGVLNMDNPFSLLNAHHPGQMDSPRFFTLQGCRVPKGAASTGAQRMLIDKSNGDYRADVSPAISK
jgi:hypothetical protein